MTEDMESLCKGSTFNRNYAHTSYLWYKAPAEATKNVAHANARGGYLAQQKSKEPARKLCK